MPIGITEEHEALRQAAHGWVERHCAPAVPRALRTSGCNGITAIRRSAR